MSSGPIVSSCKHFGVSSNGMEVISFEYISKFMFNIHAINRKMLIEVVKLPIFLATTPDRMDCVLMWYQLNRKLEKHIQGGVDSNMTLACLAQIFIEKSCVRQVNAVSQSHVFRNMPHECERNIRFFIKLINPCEVIIVTPNGWDPGPGVTLSVSAPIRHPVYTKRIHLPKSRCHIVLMSNEMLFHPNALY